MEPEENVNIPDKTIKVCPACGFNFRSFEEKKKCPKCGYEFGSPNVPPRDSDDFKKRKI